MNAILAVKNLTKAYGPKLAVDNISFSVARHEIVGLLGPNGAGKTTTINMILGVLEPTAGDIEINGINVRTHRRQALTATNFAAVYTPLPGNLTVRQNLRVFGLLYDVKNLSQKITELTQRFELGRFLNTKCGLLSSGEQTRVALAKALLNEPRLLLLDEPTASLDPSVAADIRAHIREVAKTMDTGVLWTSHNMYEVEEVCDRVLFLAQGKILLEGDPKTLPGQHGKKSLEELFIAVARLPAGAES